MMMTNRLYKLISRWGAMGVLALGFLGCDSAVGPSTFIGTQKVIIVPPFGLDTTKWPIRETNIDSSWIVGDMLYVDLECLAAPSRSFNLVAFYYWIDTNPTGVGVLISYEPIPGSEVRARYLLKFDLTPLKEYRLQWDPGEKELEIYFEPYTGESVEYYF